MNDIFRKNIVTDLMVICFFTAGMISTVSAEEKSKSLCYIGITIPYTTVNGDFDGKSYMVDWQEVVYLVPKVESNFGWGFLFGIRRQKFAGEFRYIESTHNVSSLVGKNKAKYHLVTFNFKYHFLSEGKPIQPYVLIGYNLVSVLRVKNGYYHYWFETETTGDAEYSTDFVPTFNIGFGSSFCFNSRVTLFGEIEYRWLKYLSVFGTTTEDIEDGLSGSGLNVITGLTIIIKHF